MIKPSAGGAGSCSRNRGALRGSGPRAARGRPRFDGGPGVPWAQDVGAVWGCDIGISTDVRRRPVDPPGGRGQGSAMHQQQMRGRGRHSKGQQVTRGAVTGAMRCRYDADMVPAR